MDIGAQTSSAFLRPLEENWMRIAAAGTQTGTIWQFGCKQQLYLHSAGPVHLKQLTNWVKENTVLNIGTVIPGRGSQAGLSSPDFLLGGTFWTLEYGPGFNQNIVVLLSQGDKNLNFKTLWFLDSVRQSSRGMGAM